MGYALPMSGTEFWTKWSAIGQIAGAFGTFAAVITSLYLSRRGEKPRLNICAGVRILISQGSTKPYPEYVSITVRNVGTQTAHVTQFGWRTGLWKWKWPAWLKRQHAIQTSGMLRISEDPPFVVPPGTKRDTMLNKELFLESIANKSGGPFFAKDWPVLRRRPTAIFIVAHLESGISVSARVEDELADELFAAERKAISAQTPADLG